MDTEFRQTLTENPALPLDLHLNKVPKFSESVLSCSEWWKWGLLSKLKIQYIKHLTQCLHVRGTQLMEATVIVVAIITL